MKNRNHSPSHSQGSVWCTAVLAGLLASSVPGLGSGAALAAYEDEPIAATTERTEKEIAGDYLRKEIVGVKPQAGVMVFKNSEGNTDSRAALALIVEMNAVSTFYKGSKERTKNWYLGPSSGIIFSHLGNPSSNFFGTDPAGARSLQGGSNFLMVPINLKVGYLWPDQNFRFSVRAGGNATYRSVAESLNFGPATSSGTNSVWRMYPNVGMDIEMGRLTIRPDLTFTPEDELFSGTIGYNIALG